MSLRPAQHLNFLCRAPHGNVLCSLVLTDVICFAYMCWLAKACEILLLLVLAVDAILSPFCLQAVESENRSLAEELARTRAKGQQAAAEAERLQKKADDLQHFSDMERQVQ